MVIVDLGKVLISKIPTLALVILLSIAMIIAGWLGSNWIESQKPRPAEQDPQLVLAFQQMVLTQNEKYAEKIEQMSLEMDSLRKEVTALRNALLALESSSNSSPFAHWVKDPFGNVLHVNDKYVDIFLDCRGYAREDYKTDYAVWPDAIANVYTENDQEVLRTGQTQVRTEPVELCDGSVVDMTFVKWARRLNGSWGRIIGVAGMHFPTPEELSELYSG
jgi:hypothetical protein